MLNPEQLHTFVAVAETGSFSAAAARLGFTQPAVSRQIKALEVVIGDVRLFRRVGKTVRLTHAGEELLLHARGVVDLLARTEQHMHGLRGQVTGRVGIGATTNGGERVVPSLLAAFQHKHPGVQFAIDTGLPDDLLGWLDNGQVQAVVLDAEPRRRAYDVVPVCNDPIVAVAAAGHPLHAHGSVEVVDLAQQRIIVPPRGVALRRAVEDLFKRHGGELAPTQIVVEAGSVLAALHVVRAGLGVAFVPAPDAALVLGVVVLSVPGLALEQPWYFVRQRSAIAQRAVDALWNFVAGTTGTASTTATEPSS
jgi:DNA-binding transcriptional LysR family regulator